MFKKHNLQWFLLFDECFEKILVLKSSQVIWNISCSKEH